MSADDETLYTKIIDDLYEYHESVENRFRLPKEFTLTATGHSILDDVRTLLQSDGKYAEKMFLQLFSILAESKIGSLPSKAND